mgnify:CR=1 FL=1
MPRPANAARKDRIIRAAVTCFLTHGYDQTGVRDIARAAGVSLGNLYNHFPSKDALLAEIAALEKDELVPFCKPLTVSSTPQTLETFVQTYATYAALPENALLTLEILTQAIRTPVVAVEFAKNRETLTTALGKHLADGSAKGIYRPFTNPTDTAKLILDLIEGHALRTCLATMDNATVPDIAELHLFVCAATLPTTIDSR